MRDYSYEDLETEAVKEREEHETFADQEAEVLLAKEEREFALDELPPGQKEASYLVGYLESCAKNKHRGQDVRMFAFEALAAFHKDCKR